MKAILNFISVIAFSVVLAGCLAQKHAAASVESKILHQQALHALEAGRFVIEVDEFYLASGKSPVPSLDSYLSVQDNQAVVRYSPEVFSNVEYADFLKMDGGANLEKMKNRKTGDTQFCLKITRTKPSWSNAELLITLFENTNQCFVQVGSPGGDRFTGCVYPQKE